MYLLWMHVFLSIKWYVDQLCSPHRPLHSMCRPRCAREGGATQQGKTPWKFHMPHGRS